MANQKFEMMWNLLSGNAYQFDHLITEDLICIDCKNLMINAHQAPCGCKFCKRCIEKYVDMENGFCPGNKEECKEEALSKNSSISVDHRANNIISRLKTKCPNEGCGDECELKYMCDHLAVCEKNPANAVSVVKGEQLMNDSDHKLIEMTNNLMNAVNSLREQEEKNRMEIDLLRELVEKLSNADNAEPVDKGLGDIANGHDNIDKSAAVGVIEQLKRQLGEREDDIRQVIEEADQRKQAYSDKFRAEMGVILDGKLASFVEFVVSIYERHIMHLRRELACSCGDRATVRAAPVVALPVIDALPLEALSLDDGPNASRRTYKLFRFDKLSYHAKKGTTLRSDEFMSPDGVYRMQLLLCSDGDSAVKEPHLTVELFVCKAGHAVGARWPLKADLTIDVRNPGNEAVVLMSTTAGCAINKNDWSAMFNFRMRDLADKAALKDDSIVIGCSLSIMN